MAVRPLFRRDHTYIALKPFSNGDVDFKVGDVVERPAFMTRFLLRRNKVGPKGHPWSEQRLKKLGYELPKPAKKKKKDD